MKCMFEKKIGSKNRKEIVGRVEILKRCLKIILMVIRKWGLNAFMQVIDMWLRLKVMCDKYMGDS